MATQIARIEPAKAGLVNRMAERFGVDPNKMLVTLKATAFRSENEVTNEQMMALLVVADQYELNPWTKEIYAFPDKKNGIIPVVGIDGWSRIINSNPAFDGMDFVESEEIVSSAEHKDCPAWIECVIYRKDRSHPIKVRERLSECYRPAFKGKYGPVVGPWQTHTARFLRHKAMIQCARIAFGYVGIFDQDEAERIQEMNTQPIIDAKPATDKRTAKQSLDYFAGGKRALAPVEETSHADAEDNPEPPLEDGGRNPDEEMNDHHPDAEG